MNDRSLSLTSTPSLDELMERAGKPMPARAVNQWNPQHSGKIDIRIDANARWTYLGSEIGRPVLVRLFSSILRRESDGSYALVTPVEKLSISVDDAPFLAVEMSVDGEGPNQMLTIRTNVGDIVGLDSAHPLRFEVELERGGLKPYIGIRDGLEALATRALAIDLVALSVDHDGTRGLWSAGTFFPFPGLTGSDDET